ATKLDWGRKLLLVSVGIAAAAGPIAVGLMSAHPTQAQSQATAPVSFEVASIKANHSVDQGSSINPTPEMFRATNVPLQLLIQAAYSVRSFQVSGGPGWINTEKYDITARTAGTVPVAQMVLMLRSLLESRFNLKVHRETK